MAKFKFIYDDDLEETKVIHTLHGVDACTEIVRQISYFLSGCSFDMLVIARAFKNVAEEIEQGYEEKPDSSRNL